MMSIHQPPVRLLHRAALQHRVALQHTEPHSIQDDSQEHKMGSNTGCIFKMAGLNNLHSLNPMARQ